MFDISFGEVLVFGILALIVLGPEKLPQAVRTAGTYYAKIRRTVGTFRAEIEAELDLVETRQKMQEELAKIRAAEADMQREMAKLRGSVKRFEEQKFSSALDKTATDSLAHATTEPNDQALAPAMSAEMTRPWESMWFRLGDYDKNRRLPSAPFLPNYNADVLLNAASPVQSTSPADSDCTNSTDAMISSDNSDSTDIASHLTDPTHNSATSTTANVTKDIDNNSSSDDATPTTDIQSRVRSAPLMSKSQGGVELKSSSGEVL